MKLEKKVEKRGKDWAVVHCTGKDKGKVIGTHPTKKEALAQHSAIMVNKMLPELNAFLTKWEKGGETQVTKLVKSKFEFLLKVEKMMHKQEGYAPMSTIEISDSFGSWDSVPDIMKSPDARPPKEWWDKCISRAGDFADDPEKYCGSLWSQEKLGKWSEGQTESMKESFGKEDEDEEDIEKLDPVSAGVLGAGLGYLGSKVLGLSKQEDEEEDEEEIEKGWPLLVGAGLLAAPVILGFGAGQMAKSADDEEEEPEEKQVVAALGGAALGTMAHKLRQQKKAGEASAAPVADMEKMDPLTAGLLGGGMGLIGSKFLGLMEKQEFNSEDEMFSEVGKRIIEALGETVQDLEKKGFYDELKQKLEAEDTISEMFKMVMPGGEKGQGDIVSGTDANIESLQPSEHQESL